MTKKLVITSPDGGETFDVGLQCGLHELTEVLEILKTFLKPAQAELIVPVKIPAKQYQKRTGTLHCETCGKTFTNERWLEKHERKCKPHEKKKSSEKFKYQGKPGTLGSVGCQDIGGSA